MEENKTIIVLLSILVVGCFLWNVWHFALGGRLGASAQQEIKLVEDNVESFIASDAEYADACSLKFVTDYVMSGNQENYNSKGSIDCKCRVRNQDGDTEYFNETFVIDNFETIRGKDCAELCAELCPTIK